MLSRTGLPHLLSLLFSFYFLPTRPLAVPVLRQVNVLFRHGARTPTHPFPTDPHLQYWQEQGLGQLTQLGMRGTYSLGQYLRQTYNSLLNETFKQKEIYVRSTDVDRTLMSAECLLAGLYPPPEGRNWNNSISWTPVPVHTEKGEWDILMNLDEVDCPAYNEMYEEIINSPSYKDWEASFSDFYAMLANYTGLPLPLDADKAWDVWDTLLCEKTENLTWPDWATEDIYNKIERDIVPQFIIYENAATPDMMIVKGGVFLGQIVRNMREMVTGQSAKNVYLYSAHDKNIVLVLRMLGLYDYEVPPYQTALIFELYETDPGQYAVKILYRPNSSEKPRELRYSDCPLLCPVDTFADKTRSLQLDPDEWDEACKVDKGSSTTSVAIGIVALLALVVFIVLLLVFIIRMSRRNRRRYDVAERAPLIQPNNPST